MGLLLYSSFSIYFALRLFLLKSTTPATTPASAATPSTAAAATSALLGPDGALAPPGEGEEVLGAGEVAPPDPTRPLTLLDGSPEASPDVVVGGGGDGTMTSVIILPKICVAPYGSMKVSGNVVAVSAKAA